ncbi:hypothetical protein BDV19DRAFT_172896 [Aspergillus venezuelensis]
MRRGPIRGSAKHTRESARCLLQPTLPFFHSLNAAPPPGPTADQTKPTFICSLTSSLVDCSLFPSPTPRSFRPAFLRSVVVVFWLFPSSLAPSSPHPWPSLLASAVALDTGPSLSPFTSAELPPTFSSRDSRLLALSWGRAIALVSWIDFLPPTDRKGGFGTKSDARAPNFAYNRPRSHPLALSRATSSTDRFILLNGGNILAIILVVGSHLSLRYPRRSRMLFV